MTDRNDSDSTIPSNSSGRWVLPPHDDPRAQTTIDALIAGEAAEAEPVAQDELVDPVTGFETRRAWEETFRNEDNRLARYGRPVTVLVAELDGLDALAERLGQGAADRLILPVATAIRRNARSADVIARLGHARFVAVMPETDEVAAINFIERVRTACDMWLEAGAVAVRLAIGWASPPAGGKLGDALRVADERMNADRRRQLRAPAPTSSTTVTVPQATAPEASGAPPSGAPPAEGPSAESAPAESAPAESAPVAGPAESPAVATPPADAPAAATIDETEPLPTDIPPFPPRGPYPGSNGPVPNPISAIEGDRDRY